MAVLERVVPAPPAEPLHQLRDLIQRDPAFAAALRATPTTQDAARLAAGRGVVVTPEALWRNRGTLGEGGRPTWRG